MDCNSYSYTAPGFGVDTPHTWTPCNRVTIERRTANGRDYFVIIANEGTPSEGSNKAYDLKTEIRTAENWIREGL